MVCREFYKEVAAQEFDLKRLLRATPFHPNWNLNRLLTPDRFFECLFRLPDTYDPAVEKLTELLFGQLASHRIVVLYGYKGIGKTTFLRYFAKMLEQRGRKAIVLDCDHGSVPDTNSLVFDYVGRVMAPGADSEWVEKRADVQVVLRQLLQIMRSEQLASLALISDTIRRHLLKQGKEQHRKKLLDFLAQEDSVMRQLCSENSKEVAAILAGVRKGEPDTERCFAELVSGKGHSFMIRLLLWETIINDFNDRGTVIILDNLDRIAWGLVGYGLSTEFMTAVGQISESITELRNHQFHGLRLHKLCFALCYRSATAALLGVTAHDLVANDMSSPYPLRSACSAAAFSEVFGSRAELAQKVGMYQKNQVDHRARIGVSLFEIAAKDEAMRRILFPLFNGDYRMTGQILLQVIAGGFIDLGELSGILDRWESPPEGYGESSELDKYAVRAAVSFNVFKQLRGVDLLQKFPFDDSSDTQKDCYCNLSRVILTRLLNTCGLAVSRDISKIDLDLKSMPLSALCEELSPLYEAEKVLLSVMTMFLVQRQGWSHLVNLEGLTPVLIQLRQKEDLYGAAFEKFVKDVVDVVRDAGLSNVHVSITPAGVVYVKNVLVNFEFYNVLTEAHAGLFLSNEVGDHKKKRKLNSLKVSNALELMKVHIGAMRKFFQDRMVASQFVTDADEFARGNFSFQYLGNGARKKKGAFHEYRLVTAAFSHIDKYRAWSCQNLSRAEASESDIREESLYWLDALNEVCALLKGSLEPRASRFVKRAEEHLKGIADCGRWRSVFRLK